MQRAGIKTVKKRRHECKTNYSKRLKLLKGGKPRVVFRKTNKYVVAQYVVSNQAQDKIEIGVTSKHLAKYGWPKEFSGSLKSISASYLTGYLLGNKILSEKKEAPIVDFGMNRTGHKTKVFAFLKGLIDSGVEINCPEEAFPEQERIEGKTMKEDFSKTFNEIKEKIGGPKNE
jgi:large subunit ribosomal protein L18